MKVYHVNANPFTNPFYCGQTMPFIVVAAPRPKIVLEYSLKPVQNALVFQVTEQSQAVTDFLKNNRFQASNGLIIAADRYPEVKDSTNHIYLRGNDSDRNLKLDVTRFISDKVRDSKSEMIKAALKEFVSFLASRVSY